MSKALRFGKLTLGVCYYPEHWPESLWAEDIARMRKAGIEIIRIAEFAWSEFEPVEGCFGGGLFDRFMDMIAKTDMKVIFCTPTATPPAWLSENYPEILNATKDGILLRHGLRKNYSYNSEVFRDKTRLIVSHVAARYANHSSIIGWQLDNEFNWGVDEFYAQADHEEFRRYLKDQYGCLDKLNEAWGNVFWNQKFTDWKEVHLERCNAKRQPNPHMALDAKRFFSWSAVRYGKLQHDILREYIPKSAFITSNGYFHHLDHNDLVDKSLDFLTHNCYPGFAFFDKLCPPEKTPLLDRMSSFALTKVRGVSPVFGVMEQQSGAGGWLSEHSQPAPKPGQMRLWTLQSIAHGADFISYFRWRTCTFGTEMYWHGILDYDSRDNRRLRETAKIHQDMQKIQCIANGRYEAKVGLLHDYDNEWDGEVDIWHGPLRSYSERNWFVALQQLHVPFDYVNMKYDKESLANYELLIYPHGTILPEEDARALEAYVKNGGKLIMGARSGYKTTNGQCRMQPMPGPLAELFGVTVEDFTYLSYLEQDSKALWDGQAIEMALFNDILELVSSECRVLATYAGDYYAGKPALTVHPWGGGEAYYFGAAFSAQAAKMILSKLDITETYRAFVALPESCEVAVRKSENGRVMFVLNYTNEQAEIQLHTPLQELFSGNCLSGPAVLPPFGVMALRLE